MGDHLLVSTKEKTYVSGVFVSLLVTLQSNLSMMLILRVT